MKQEEQQQIEGWAPRRRRQEDELTERERRKLRIRNWLNIIFMITALAGVIYYLAADRTVGIFIILTAMSIKIVESSMRMIK